MEPISKRIKWSYFIRFEIGSYKCSGTLGKSAKGTITFVGGTGKFVGITGTGEFTRHSLRAPAKGVFASFSVSKASWKLPEKK